MKQLARAKSTALLVLLALIIPVLGCGKSGPKLVKISGVVTFQGKPLARGLINYTPVDNGTRSGTRTSVGIIDTNGRYSMSTFSTRDGVLPGEYMVSIDGGMDPPGSSGSIELTADGQPAAPGKAEIPIKYSSVSTSGLTASVPAESDEIEINFDLKP
jgi:hypothetical protein